MWHGGGTSSENNLTGMFISTMRVSGGNPKFKWQEVIDDDWEERERFWKKPSQRLPAYIKYGDGINAQNEKNETPLHHAVIHGADVAIIKELRKAGADINAKNKRGDTPYNLAVLQRNADVIKALKRIP